MISPLHHYIIGTDASTITINTKFGNMNASCCTYSSYDENRGEMTPTKSYIIIDEDNDFAEAFALHLALYDFTNPAIPEARSAVFNSDSVVAIDCFNKFLIKFITGEMKPKWKKANSLKNLSYNNAVLAYRSLYPVRVLYQPAHMERFKNGSKIDYRAIRDKSLHENDKLGLDITNITPDSISTTSFSNQISDRVAYTILQNYKDNIKQIISTWEEIPSRKERYFPLRIYENQLQCLTPICYRENRAQILGLTPQALAMNSSGNYKVKPMIRKEGVLLRGDSV